MPRKKGYKGTKKVATSYLEEIRERAKKSRVYSEHQLIGLIVAQILDDEEHKSLYMKLVKEHGADKLLKIAKSVADRKRVKNRGGYFMKLLQIEKSKSKSRPKGQ